MESTVIEEGAEAPEAQMSGDFYYMKAMNYLASSSSENVQSDTDTCSCLSAEDKEDDHFTSGFRRGLTRDQDDLNSSGSTSSSPIGSDAPTSHHFSTVSSSPTPGSPRRQRKCSIGGRFYKTGPSEFGKIEPKRKLSDGHVHWADEFHKDLARCHPRKSYSRHPSHLSPQVKPILKSSNDDNEEC